MDPRVPSASTPTSSSSSLPNVSGGGASGSSSGSISSSIPNQPQFATGADPSTMVQCPACAQLVPMTLINQHLDQNCQSFAGTSPFSTTYLPGTGSGIGNGKGKSKQTTPTSSYYRQPSLHTFFGGVDPTIPNDFILTRNTAKGATLEATFSRHGMQTLARVEWSASVYLRGLKKSIVLATDIKLDELADELGQLSIQPLFDGEEEFDDSEFGDEDEDGQDDVVWVEEEHSGDDMQQDGDAMDIDQVVPVATAASTACSSSIVTTQPPAPTAPLPDNSAPTASPTPLPPPSQRQESRVMPDAAIRYVPYLKSHLQKCIRRRLVDQSVSTALALINVNYNEFIRRIPIIAVEDARVFGAAYPVLVWLMLAASKGYTPLPQSLVPDVLGAVAQIAASNVQDKGWMHCPKGQRGNEVTVVLNSIEVAEGLPRWARDILWSIRCRREFGGMAGDIKMLDQSLICLFHRFSTCPDRSVLESQFLAPVPILPAQAIPGPIQPNRFLLNAIDFHVSPIIAHLAARYPQFSEDLLKATIWECSSGVNRRSAATNWDPVKAKAGDPSQGWEWDTPREYAPSTELVHVWRAIEGEFMKVAMEYLVKRGCVA